MFLFVILFLMLLILNLGLLMLKDWIIIMFGGDMKFFLGIGIFLMMYSYMMSMLYLSCVEMGMMGVLLVMVFCKMWCNEML